MKKHITLLFFVPALGFLVYGLFSEEVIEDAKPFLAIAISMFNTAVSFSEYQSV